MAKKSRQVTSDDEDLLDDLGVEAGPVSTGGRSAREQRILAGFEQIERFVEEHGRLPEHGESRDIFERLYAVRLDRIRQSSECREVVKGLDLRHLLGEAKPTATGAVTAEMSDEDLLAELGVDAQPGDEITQLVHVRPREEINAAEEIAQRNPCRDFERFRPIFEAVQHDLETGRRHTLKYGEYARIKKRNLFILDGQKVLVADLGDEFVTGYGRTDRRLRVVYDNGTESDLLLRSLQRALQKDKASRRISEPGIGPLFADQEEEGDLATGYIYVLRSQSDHPFVAQHRDLIHKIGITGGDVQTRIAGARKDPTYLLADVEIVATFRLANVNRNKLEAVLRQFFQKARLDLELKDRFGFQVEPREWFLVPFSAIDEAIQKIKDETIGEFRYDPESANIVPQ